MDHAYQRQARRSAGRFTAALLVCLASAASPANSAEPLADATDNEVLWTDRPVRVDPSKQSYERLPSRVVIDPHSAGMSIPAFIKVTDSATFAFGGKTYRIRNILPIKAGRICKTSTGRRWACGRMSMVFLGRLVRARRIQCDTAIEEGGLVLIDCNVGRRNIAEAIIARGFGHAIAKEPLIEIERQAIAGKAGIWENPACIENFSGC